MDILIRRGALLATLLTAFLSLAVAQEQGTSQPSLGEVARKLQAERAKENVKDVPLYTNDNLPAAGRAPGVIGSPSSPSSLKRAASAKHAFSKGSASAKDLAYLRSKLSQAQLHLRMDERELSVLQQEMGQRNMQYYPNPNETLMQEYTRQDINKLVQEINQKKQQITAGQQAVQGLKDRIQQALGPFGSSQTESSAPAAGQLVLPPDVKPGTKAYWQARFRAAQEQLSTAEEEQALAEDELKLLKLQQLRTLDRNLQSALTVKQIDKQKESEAARQAVEKARQQLEALQKEFQASGAPPGWAE